MENDKLSEIWNSQTNDSALDTPDLIIKKAKKHRIRQYIGIVVMSATVLVLLLYTLSYASFQWNNFTLGLLLMMGSLVFRIVLEFVTIYRKESQLVSMDNSAFQTYLKKHYHQRVWINYLITPLCFGVYIYGFTKLLPYFKREFSEDFYTYILVSGIVSLVALVLLIASVVRKERRFLRELH